MEQVNKSKSSFPYEKNGISVEKSRALIKNSCFQKSKSYFFFQQFSDKTIKSCTSKSVKNTPNLGLLESQQNIVNYSHIHVQKSKISDWAILYKPFERQPN